MAALTARELYQTLLAHINKRDGASGERGEIPEGTDEYALQAIIGAQEIMREKAPSLFARNISLSFPGHRTGPLMATAGASIITPGTILATANNGETILVDGDPIHNEIFSGSGIYQLVKPYGGTTGTHSATAFGDCAALPIEADRILGNAYLPDRRQLTVLASRMDYAYYSNTVRGDYGLRGVSGPVNTRYVGVPEAIWLETWNSPDSDYIEYRLHCAPLPSGPFTVSLDIVIKPTEPVAADLAEDGDFYFSVPGGRDRTILKPIALYLWTENPMVAPPPELRKRIEAGYAQAIASLEAFKPNAQASGQIIVNY